ncbi:pyrroloquinoline quinone biosynthesis protein PqqB [Hanstruepera neustonica]|uniref:Pyrroloquinoline quinone biosynthesis protein PqqB n=1 Tax=Hanstruepera neustonica TaxID=1445657 RepID=A0A2K1DZC3_9FLAO|nr:MBL fold metallo-hydrolase [Hanstruepera neustonica]PNQ73379.1 pyrroloquinoline quinone biosynthesis protein PqqB [Hanstruepera neustonica]
MKPIQLLCLIIFMLFIGCDKKTILNVKEPYETSRQYITVLGIAQDAGYPQIGCEKKCCASFYGGLEDRKLVSCLGLVDLNKKGKWLFDATPDITEQVQILKEKHLKNDKLIDGVFLTHAHIGHYTGLMYFGREAIGANRIPVYTMPRMKSYLENNGPWSQLITLDNIDLKPLQSDSTIVLNTNLKVTPLLVPHRDEYSETVGYKIEGKNKSALFIPDIDKWNAWNRNIIDEVKKVDYAFLDASFFADGELERDMSKIPHPFTTETTSLFENESLETKNKIHFIHFNHTNPAIKDSHPLKDSLQNLGFRFPKEGSLFEL